MGISKDVKWYKITSQLLFTRKKQPNCNAAESLLEGIKEKSLQNPYRISQDKQTKNKQTKKTHPKPKTKQKKKKNESLILH